MKNFFSITLGVFLLFFPKCQHFCEANPGNSPHIALFNYNEVKLLPSPFLSAMSKDVELLQAVEPDKFLSGFRSEAGLEPKASKYGGWESDGVAGQSFGHYLSAYAIWYAYSGDQNALKKLNYCMDELELCQKTNGNGYLAATPNGKRIFKEVSEGNIYSKGFDLNGGWVPVYVMHKVLAGLMDVYIYTGNKKALNIAQNLGNFLYATFAHLTNEQIQKVLDCEHGGIKESLANLYGLTNEKRFLELSGKFTHTAITDPLEHHQDHLSGLHANTQVPKIVGSARYYELANNPNDSVIASFFWETVTQNHTYVNGGNSDGEHFGDPGKLSNRLSLSNSETCNSYNMLKLTEHLFCWNPVSKYMDFYEKSMYNHILATISPETGTGMYYTPLVSGGKKSYLSFDYPVCCSGTSMENHVKYNRLIYAKSDKQDILVNLFIPSVLDWKEKKITISQYANIPANNTSELIINTPSKSKFRLMIRSPYWSKNTRIFINTEEIQCSVSPQGYFVLERTWKNNDKVTLQFGLETYTVAMPDNDKRVGLFYGPVLLAADLGEKDIDMESQIPVIIPEDKTPETWISKISDYPLRFKMHVAENPSDVTLIPMYNIHKQYYQVYWDIFGKDEWKKIEDKYKAERKKIQELEKITLDYCVLGEMQPERDHNFRGHNTPNGLFNKKKFRGTWLEGWFSFEMKVSPDQPVDMVVTYWGQDANKHEFDLLIDDYLLEKQELPAMETEDFRQVVYHLPAGTTKDKEKMTVRFNTIPNKMTPRVFNCRTILRSPK